MLVGGGAGNGLFSVGGLFEAAARVLCVDGGDEVDEEGEDVKGEDEGDDPLKDGGDVAVVGEGGGGEDDGEGELDEDKGELDPKGDAEGAVLAVPWGRGCQRTTATTAAANDALMPRRWYSQQMKMAEMR